MSHGDGKHKFDSFDENECEMRENNESFCFAVVYFAFLTRTSSSSVDAAHKRFLYYFINT